MKNRENDFDFSPEEEEVIEIEDSDEWDPVIGMREEDRKNKPKNNDWQMMLCLILLFAVGIPSGIFFLSKSWYKSDKDPKTATLEKLIKNLGTKIKDRKDCEPGVLGYYEFEKYKVDQVVICRNNLLADGPNAQARYWKLLAHEATHIMQACLGTTIFGPIQHRDMSYVLLDKEEDSYRAIHGLYVKRDEGAEIEARWMEMQSKDYVIQELGRHCGLVFAPEAYKIPTPEIRLPSAENQ